MNTAWTGPPSKTVEIEVGLEGAQLTPERVALGADVEHSEVIAVEHDHPGARPEHRRTGAGQVAQRVAEPLPLDSERDHGRLAPGDYQRVEPLEVGRHADLAAVGADPRELGVRLEAALQGQDPDHAGRSARSAVAYYQPRGASSCSDSSLEVSRLTIGWPSPVEAAAATRRIPVVRGGLDDRARRDAPDPLT